jgi:AraC-like DNA-binding protein
MRYAEYAPSPRFRALVEKLWLLEGHATGAADAVLPDGRMELIFHYEGAFWRHRDEGEPVEQPLSLLVGQMIEPVILTPRGYAGVAAIRLRPAAARTLFRLPMTEISGRFVDLESIFPNVSTLRARLAEAPDDEHRIGALEQWLLDLACPPPRRDVEAAVAAVLRSGGRTSIESLSLLAGTGVRQLERQFRDDVGLSPKVFSRIVRLQSALRRIRDGLPLSHVALACGYYDQAHMTRDFRQLAAMSPGMWQSHSGDLAPLFLGSR